MLVEAGGEFNGLLFESNLFLLCAGQVKQAVAADAVAFLDVTVKLTGERQGTVLDQGKLLANQ